MRISYRANGVKYYWAKRWEDIPADLPMENKSVYPLKYAEITVMDKSGKILEAGCGAGRILRYYHDNGYNILGFDFIDVAIDKLKDADPGLQVGDITDLRFEDQSFDPILAFGLYHNLEQGLDQAVAETYRILKQGGKVCASFRADNIQNRWTDWLTDRRARKDHGQSDNKEFHKMNLTRREFEKLFEKAGFVVESVYPVENMPILYKFRMFRAHSHKVFDENRARAEGYRLSWFGQRLQNFLMRFFQDQFCNIYVIIARKD